MTAPVDQADGAVQTDYTKVLEHLINVEVPINMRQSARDLVGVLRNEGASDSEIWRAILPSNDVRLTTSLPSKSGPKKTLSNGDHTAGKQQPGSYEAAFNINVLGVPISPEMPHRSVPSPVAGRISPSVSKVTITSTASVSRVPASVQVTVAQSPSPFLVQRPPALAQRSTPLPLEPIDVDMLISASSADSPSSTQSPSASVNNNSRTSVLVSQSNQTQRAADALKRKRTDSANTSPVNKKTSRELRFEMTEEDDEIAFTSSGPVQVNLARGPAVGSVSNESSRLQREADVRRALVRDEEARRRRNEQKIAETQRLTALSAQTPAPDPLQSSGRLANEMVTLEHRRAPEDTGIPKQSPTAILVDNRNRNQASIQNSRDLQSALKTETAFRLSENDQPGASAGSSGSPRASRVTLGQEKADLFNSSELQRIAEKGLELEAKSFEKARLKARATLRAKSKSAKAIRKQENADAVEKDRRKQEDRHIAEYNAATLEKERQEQERHIAQSNAATLEKVRQEQEDRHIADYLRSCASELSRNEIRDKNRIKEEIIPVEAYAQPPSFQELDKETLRREVAPPARKDGARVREEVDRKEEILMETARLEVVRQEGMRKEAARLEIVRQEAVRKEAAHTAAARQEELRKEAARKEEEARKESARRRESEEASKVQGRGASREEDSRKVEQERVRRSQEAAEHQARLRREEAARSLALEKARLQQAVIASAKARQQEAKETTEKQLAQREQAERARELQNAHQHALESAKARQHEAREREQKLFAEQEEALARKAALERARLLEEAERINVATEKARAARNADAERQAAKLELENRQKKKEFERVRLEAEAKRKAREDEETQKKELERVRREVLESKRKMAEAAEAKRKAAEEMEAKRKAAEEAEHLIKEEARRKVALEARERHIRREQDRLRAQEQLREQERKAALARAAADGAQLQEQTTFVEAATRHREAKRQEEEGRKREIERIRLKTEAQLAREQAQRVRETAIQEPAQAAKARFLNTSVNAAAEALRQQLMLSKQGRLSKPNSPAATPPRGLAVEDQLKTGPPSREKSADTHEEGEIAEVPTFTRAASPPNIERPSKKPNTATNPPYAIPATTVDVEEPSGFASIVASLAAAEEAKVKDESQPSNSGSSTPLLSTQTGAVVDQSLAIVQHEPSRAGPLALAPPYMPFGMPPPPPHFAMYQPQQDLLGGITPQVLSRLLEGVPAQARDVILANAHQEFFRAGQQRLQQQWQDFGLQFSRAQPQEPQHTAAASSTVPSPINSNGTFNPTPQQNFAPNFSGFHPAPGAVPHIYGARPTNPPQAHDLGGSSAVAAVFAPVPIPSAPTASAPVAMDITPPQESMASAGSAASHNNNLYTVAQTEETARVMQGIQRRAAVLAQSKAKPAS